MADIYRKNKYENITEESSLKEMIKVVPSSFKAIMIALIVIIVITVLWLALGYTGNTVTISGVYHPGAAAEGEVLCFPYPNSGKLLAPGMKASVFVNGYDQSKYGHIKGEVAYVDAYITSEEEMAELLGEESMVGVFTQGSPCVLVVIKLYEDETSANGYEWSNQNGESIVLNDGTFVSASVMISEDHPMFEDLF